MAHYKFLLAGAFALAMLSGGAASATVVTFDDLSGSGTVADGYGGIIWARQLHLLRLLSASLHAGFPA